MPFEDISAPAALHQRLAAIALGSNLGDSRATLSTAIDALSRLSQSRRIRCSSWYQTAPIGPSREVYTNGAILLETTLPADQLLESLHEIESQCGRVRTERWSARTLDLDLIYLGDEIHDDPNLRVPHPAAFYRRFVLDPLAEIAPEWGDPIRGATVRQLRDRLLRRPFPVILLGPQASEIVPILAGEFPETRLFAFRSASEIADGSSHRAALKPETTALIVNLLGDVPPDELRSWWLDLWGHQTTPIPGPKDVSTTIERLREVLASALGR